MEFVYKKVIFLLFMCFFIEPCFADVVKDDSVDCKKEDVSDFIKYLDTVVCEVDGNDWLNKCLQHPGDCYGSSAKFCFGMQIKACNEVLDKEYQSAIGRAKKEECEAENKKEGCEWERLEQSQIYWQKFIVSDCKIGIDFNGSGSWSLYYDCQLGKIKERIKKLKKLRLK